MKKLTAEEFATKVMENGTEIEYEDFESASRDCQIWTIYAHITEDGDLVRCCDDAEETITTKLVLDDQSQSDALMNGELDDMEKQVIIDKLYPKYLKVLEDME